MHNIFPSSVTISPPTFSPRAIAKYLGISLSQVKRVLLEDEAPSSIWGCRASARRRFNQEPAEVRKSAHNPSATGDRCRVDRGFDHDFILGSQLAPECGQSVPGRPTALRSCVDVQGPDPPVEPFAVERTDVLGQRQPQEAPAPFMVRLD
jgi:hypothetical protein